MNFAQHKAAVRRQLNEAGVTFYTDDDIAQAVNDGYAEMADATEFFERHANIPMLKKRTYYDLTTILSDTFLSTRRVYYESGSVWLRASDMQELDRHTYSQWELTEGTPQMMFMRGNWWLGVFPKESTNTYKVARLYYTSIPDPLVDDDDEPLFDEEYQPGLSEYALSDLLGQARETKKALGHWAAYLGYQQQLKDFVEGRVRLARTPVL